MPKILVQTDDEQTVQAIDFPIDSVYGLTYMPSCPQHIVVNRLLSQLRRALQDAEAVQGGQNHPERLAERVMQSLHENTYRVVRFHADEQHPDHRKVIDSGLTLQQAQDHCRREDTHGDDWFDGFEVERES